MTESEKRTSEQISLRPASLEDREFLFGVYASTRQDEIEPWGWSPQQQQVFLRMQFDVRSRGYTATYPSAVESLILIRDVPAGSMIVFRSPVEMRIVDIALLPQFRNQGIGSYLIRELISESASSKTPLRLSVHKGNQAAHLYERLGFVVKGDDAMYSEMEYALSSRS